MNALIPSTSHGTDLTPFRMAQAVRNQRRARMQVFNHGLQTAVAVEIDRLDNQAIADVITTATAAELEFLDYGLARAYGSAAKAELVARKANLLSTINNRRIARRFGR